LKNQKLLFPDTKQTNQKVNHPLRRIPDSVRRRVLDSLFSGKTYRETAKDERVSLGTISEIFKDFVGEAEESSIIEVAEKHDISEKLDRLLELAKEWAKLKTDVPSLLSAARLTSFMKGHNLTCSARSQQYTQSPGAFNA
jgi:hypothetical protein